MLGSYAKQIDWGRSLVNMPALSLDEAQSIIDRWNPFDKRDSSVAHMCELYPNFLLISMAAHAEEYSIHFPSYMDKKSYQRVAEDGMFIRNHDFNETTELV